MLGLNLNLELGFLFGAGASTISRFITELTGAGGQYYELSAPLSAPADFEIEFTFMRTTNTGGSFILYSYDTVVGGYGLSIYSTGDYGIGTGSIGLFGTNAPYITGLTVNTLYHIKYVTEGNIITSYLDGVLVGTQPAFSRGSGYSSAEITRVGRNSATGFKFDGYVLDLLVRTGVAKEVILDLPLNESWSGDSRIAVNKATTLGEEKWVNPIIGVGWSEVASGVYSIANNAAYTEIKVVLPENGKTYLVVADHISTGGLTFRADGIVVSPTLFTDGTLNAIVKTNSTGDTTLSFVRSSSSSPLTATISNISIREIPNETPYASAENVSLSDATLFKSYDFGYANQFWPNNNTWSDRFDASPWVKRNTCTVSDNTVVSPENIQNASLVNLPATGDYLFRVSDLKVGVKQTYALFVKGIAGDIFRLSINSNNSSNVWTETTEGSSSSAAVLGKNFTLDGTWQRLELSGIPSHVSSGGYIYAGDRRGGLHTAQTYSIWRAQLEESSKATTQVYTEDTTSYELRRS